jgi:hypothetical protein
MKIYIAGKISGLDPTECYDSFCRVAQLFERMGAEVVNPAELINSGQEYSWADAMRISLKKMLECDMVALMPNWRDSRGACLEYYLAKQFDMPVVFLPEPVDDNLKWDGIIEMTASSK